MTLSPATSSRFSAALFGVVVCAVAGWAFGPFGSASASEVISAIPGAAQPPVTAMVIDTIEAGTRGPGPAAHQRRQERCAGGRCAVDNCGHAGCRHGDCDVPGCPAHCPVRPASFGFYGTQWRTWPGQDVAQATHVEPAAPVMPPKSEVPTADEESPVPGFELPAPEPEGGEAGAPDSAPLDPVVPDAVPPRPQPEEPAPLPQPLEQPRIEKPAVPAEDNLFDEAALRRRSQERLATLRQTAMQQERVRLEALRQQARRLSRAAVSGAASVSAASLPAVIVAAEEPVAAAIPLPEMVADEEQPLAQAVHAEPQPSKPQPRGLRSATRKPVEANPLR